jgi:hypothetical protein
LRARRAIQPVLQPNDALHVAAPVFGPLNIAVLAFAAVWAAAPFAERGWLYLGAIPPALSPAIVSYGMTGVVHRHVAIAVVPSPAGDGRGASAPAARIPTPALPSAPGLPAWRVPPSTTVPSAIDAAEISLLLGCETPAGSAFVEDIPTATLLDQTRTGHPPPWLRQINENSVSGQVLYEVFRPATGRKSLPGAEANR